MQNTRATRTAERLICRASIPCPREDQLFEEGPRVRHVPLRVDAERSYANVCARGTNVVGVRGMRRVVDNLIHRGHEVRSTCRTRPRGQGVAGWMEWRVR
jgi:hypothetical protein